MGIAEQNRLATWIQQSLQKTYKPTAMALPSKITKKPQAAHSVL